jgi:hypothetical protein
MVGHRYTSVFYVRLYQCGFENVRVGIREVILQYKQPLRQFLDPISVIRIVRLLINGDDGRSER